MAYAAGRKDREHNAEGGKGKQQVHQRNIGAQNPEPKHHDANDTGCSGGKQAAQRPDSIAQIFGDTGQKDRRKRQREQRPLDAAPIWQQNQKCHQQRRDDTYPADARRRDPVRRLHGRRTRRPGAAGTVVFFCPYDQKTHGQRQGKDQKQLFFCNNFHSNIFPANPARRLLHDVNHHALAATMTDTASVAFVSLAPVSNAFIPPRRKMASPRFGWLFDAELVALTRHYADHPGFSGKPPPCGPPGSRTSAGGVGRA